VDATLGVSEGVLLGGLPLGGSRLATLPSLAALRVSTDKLLCVA
jgi:hypothetical protein